MKAVVLEQFGNIDGLQFNEVPVPEPGPGEVLIRVHYAAVNPYDWKVIEVFGQEQDIKLPIIPGSELSGSVEKIGKDVTKFQRGDAVCGNLGTYGGCFAEFAIAKETEIVKIPEQVSFETAAAVAVGALTASKAIFDTAHLQSGQTILIHGASGGIGSLAVQLAKLKGAHVIATASGKNETLVKELGAVEFIDYTAQNFAAFVKDADVVLDTIGGKTQDESFKVLKEGGHLVSLVKPPSKELAAQYKVTAQMIFGGPNAERLIEIVNLVKEGKLKVLVEKIIPLSEAREAVQLIKNGRRTGKILLRCA